MRVNKWSLATMFAAVAFLPTVATAQTSCDATGTPATCNQTKDATAAVGNLLHLSLTGNTITLNGAAGTTDSSLYAKTFEANGDAEGTTGSAVSTIATLTSANNADTVTVFGNRAFEVTLQASKDIFRYVDDQGYGQCRPSATAADCGTPISGSAGKPTNDVYFQTTVLSGGGSAVAWQQLPLASGTATKIADFTTGGRWAAKVDLKSAWFYKTDIPGTYTATLVYTVTGK